MRIIITLTKELDALWGTEEELAGMTDEEIIALVHEDIAELLDDAFWTVTRSEEKAGG